MVASLITYPHEVLRTRLQIRKENSNPPSADPTSSPSSSRSGGSTQTSAHSITPTGSSTAPPRLFPVDRTLYSPLVSGSNPPDPLPGRNGNGNGNNSGGAAASRWKGKEGGIVDTFLSIRRQDGWRGFYRGLSINLVRTVPNSAVTMLT